MPYHWKWVGLILAYMAGVVHADPWDDFANNLFSDLAPLLALFGERATMQFMSQALGWEDCVILAMAPLGIITILVSAIRVGGPAWLKAVVGRARENMSAAEMELMSSTSKEVCELYNGQTIVRCQGSTPVWEFIYLTPIDPQNQAPKGKLDIKVLTLDEAGKEDRKLLRKLEDGPPERETPPSEDSPPSSTSKMATIFHRVFASPSSPSTRDVSIERGIRPETVPEQSPDEAIYVIRNMGSDAPNIILNLQNHNSNRRELRAFASVGVILQLCILVFFGIITYHPNVKNKFQKDDQRVDDYAFPLALSGTLVLALGIFLCGTVVESSTRETHYKRNDKYEMRIVWIQQKQTVGDQVFEAFATFPDAPRDVVTMSRRCDKAKARPLEPLTIIGISTGLAGFIIQFIGLRGMNSVATLAQLGAVGIMVAIRAWVRRGLAIPPCQGKLASGFELDSLVWVLTLLNQSQNERPGQGASGTGPEQGSVPVSSAKQRNTRQRADQGPRYLAQVGSMGRFMNHETQKHCLWGLSTGGDVDHRPFLQTRSPLDSRAQQVFETRWNLSRLARFKGASAAEAVNLVTAMEKIMSVLFPLSSDDPEKAWAWPLAVAYGDSESAASECHVHISLIGKDRKWKVLADQLESVLSLCLFTAQKQEESRSKDSQAEFNLNDENDDWLRQKTIDSGLGIRLLGSTDAEKTDQLIQHLRWWAPEALDVLAEIQEVVKFHDEKDNNTEVSVERNSNTEVSVEDQSNQPQSSQKEEIDIEKETREELDQILKPDPKWDAIRVEDNRVVGYGAARPRSQSESTKQRLFQNFSVLKNAEREENRRGTLAIESNDSLEKLFAKDLLFSFLFSAAKTLPAALQTNVETRETTAGSSPNDTPRVLVTKEMTFLVAELSRLGYGTEQEAWLSIIAPLSMTGKLPFPRLLLDLAKERAEKFRQPHRWMKVNEIYLELWKQTQRLSPSAEKIRGRVTAFMLEHLCDLENEKKRLEVEGFEHEPPGLRLAFEQIRRSLPVSKHQPDFFTHLQRLYERQKRPFMLERLPVSTPQDGCILQDSFPDYFGITEVHSKAMDLKENGFGIRGKGVWNAVNERDICDWTPLHYAIISRNEAAIGALADERADPNLKNLKGYTPVHYLCQAGYDEYDWEWMDRWRLDARGLDGATPMHMAASSGNLKVIEEQIYREQHVLEEKAQPMERALKLRDFNGRLPIHWAVIHGHERVVEILKSTVEEPDIHGWTPLHLAALYHKSGSTMIETVFKLSADRERTDKTGCAPLVLACEKSKRQAVDELIKLGAEVNSETPNGEAALHYAIRQEDVKLVKILLDRGVKVSRTYNDPDSYTALHVAVKVGNGQVMETILDSLDSKTRSEYINFRDFAGRTPLHLAASLKRPEVMALLLSAGAYPNRRDPQGRTPLHSVFEESWRVDSREKESGRHILEMATILVENGADPEAQDASSETPLDLAEKNGFTDAADYLRGVPEARKSART